MSYLISLQYAGYSNYYTSCAREPGYTNKLLQFEILVAVVCLEHENDVRRFMLRAQQLGMSSRDYVYILPDFVRDNNRSELWLDYESNKNADGRNAEAKDAFRPTLMVSKYSIPAFFVF